MQKSQFRKYGLLFQIGVWLIFFMVLWMEEWDYAPAGIAALYSFGAIFISAAMVYIHYFLILPLFNQRQYFKYFPLTIILISAASIASYYWDLPFLYDPDWEYPFLGNFIYYNCLHALVLAVTSMYYFVEAWFQNIEIESSLRNEKLQAELNFLKSQINPHFLFNTLNNIYAYAQGGNEKTAPMLAHLSSILRFMVYDCSEDRVELAKEVKAVEDLLEIQKMKNSEQRNIRLKVEGVKRFHLIAPLIIVNFVENACKHSDVVSNPEGFIDIKISVDQNDHCKLVIANSVKQSLKKDKYSGLGLDNIRKRLDLQYGDKHIFTEEKSASIYRLNLNIPLERKQ